MNVAVRIFLKLFLVFGLSFGLMMSLKDFIFTGKFDFIKLVFWIVSSGGLMSWFTISRMKKTSLKFGGTKLSEENLKTCQTEFLTKEISIQEMYEFLKSSEKASRWNFELKDSKIVGRTRISWVSWGERITITDLSDRIKIESRPVFKTIILDSGKNRENVFLIKELIETK